MRHSKLKRGCGFKVCNLDENGEYLEIKNAVVLDATVVFATDYPPVVLEGD